jgi:hypothetical protein
MDNTNIRCFRILDEQNKIDYETKSIIFGGIEKTKPLIPEEY